MEWERPQRLFARRALTEQGWQHDVLISIKDGFIANISAGAKADPHAPSFDLLLPGMANVHSHAFQRAMAGLTEVAAQKGRDNFWTWREVMYAFACALSPEQVEIIATALYIDLLKHGYTSIGEFHYLHNDPAGKPYANATELSDRIAAAAQATGIQLTLLPVLYETSDFSGAAPLERQRRFLKDSNHFLKLVEALIPMTRSVPGLVIGVAPHSLRAVKPDSIKAVLNALPRLGLRDCPIHIHVAEQEKEVNDCLAWSGSRPLAWLLSHAPVDERWCLIHCTHITPDEMNGLIRSGATAGLCPSTEANLGDGVFPAEAFLKARGKFAIGTDSNCCVSPWQELRLMEYAQRLSVRRRAVLSDDATPSVGRTLYTSVAKNGARALGIQSGVLAAGNRADLIAVAMDDPLLAGKEGDRILDALIFGLEQPEVSDVFVAGQQVIKSRRHIREEESNRAFGETMRELCSAI